MTNTKKSFLDELVDEVDHELGGAGVAPGSQPQPTENTEVPSGGREQNANAQPAELDSLRYKSTRVVLNRSDSIGRPPSLHLKARVQKSIRFLPQLIVAVDEHLRGQPPGEEQTLQQIMNEALADWLRRRP